MAPQNGDPDHQAHSPLIGGSAISTFIRGGSLNSYGMGTLGFFASKNNVPKYNNVVLVSNFHVLGDHGGVKGNKVYQPSWTQINGGWKENEDSNPVGVLDDLPPLQYHPYQYPGDPDPPNGDPLKYFVDCATALLDICVSPICHTNCGVKFSDSLRGLDLNGNSKITGVGRMTTADEGKTVYIVGAVSGVIQGTLSRALYSDGRRLMNVMQIDSHDSIDRGDSGSAVIDENGLLVGLLSDSTGLTWSWACHIAPVLDLLGVTPITAANEPDNPAFSANAAPAATPAAVPATPAGMLRRRLSETENGRRIAALIEEHRNEVVHLVNHERAVTVAWHRNKGPQFLSEAAVNACQAEHRVPREIDGVSREALIRNLAKVLYEHGSARLRALSQHLEELVRYANSSDSLHELLSMLGGAGPV